MDDGLIVIYTDFLRFDPHATFPCRPASHNVADDVKLSLALWGERKPLRCVLKKLSPDLRRRIVVPVVWLLGATDDCPALQRTGDAERP